MSSHQARKGNSTDRRRRKLWLLSPEAGFGGNGEKVACVHCDAMLAYSDIDVDRIVCGGSYGRQNIQPSCAPCNRSRQNNRPGWVAPLVAAAMAATV